MDRIVSAIFSIALVVSFIWALRTLGRIRRDQLALFRELDRVAKELGVPPRQQPMVSCPGCRTRYTPELTGCPRCGRVKPESVTLVLVDVPAGEHAIDAVSEDRSSASASPAI